MGGIGLLGETETTSVNFTWELVNSTNSKSESQNNDGAKDMFSMILIVSLITWVLAMNSLHFL